jgi:hypothetical protein
VLLEGGGGNAANYCVSSGCSGNVRYVGDRTNGTSEITMQFMVPVDTTFTRLLCRAAITSGTLGTTTFRVRVNAVDTSFTCAAATTAATTATGSLSVTAGDLVSVSVVSTSSTQRNVWWALS